MLFSCNSLIRCDYTASLVSCRVSCRLHHARHCHTVCHCQFWLRKASALFILWACPPPARRPILRRHGLSSQWVPEENGTGTGLQSKSYAICSCPIIQLPACPAQSALAASLPRSPETLTAHTVGSSVRFAFSVSPWYSSPPRCHPPSSTTESLAFLSPQGATFPQPCSLFYQYIASYQSTSVRGPLARKAACERASDCDGAATRLHQCEH